MYQNPYDEQITKKNMQRKWLFLLIPIYIMLTAGIISISILLYYVITLAQWFTSIVLVGILSTFLWAAIKIFRLTKTKTPTKIFGVPEETGYMIYAINEWTGDEKTTRIPYNKVQKLLIGVWTNRNFKGRQHDIVGARLILYHPEIKEVNRYTSSVALDENSLTEWAKCIQDFDIPTVLTPMNISNVKTEQFDQLFNTVPSIPYDGTFSIKTYFEEQEQFITWQEPS